MSIIDKATAHYRSKLDGSLLKARIDEWEEDVYYYPTTSLKDESSILKLQQEGKTVEALVQTLIVKCRKPDGSKMFAPADKVTLMNEVDPKIIIRIAMMINTADAESVEDIEKN